MFFVGLIVFGVCASVLPWFSMSVVAFLFGIFFGNGGVRRDLELGASAGVAHAAGAFYWDGRNFGLISKRMSGLFMLPSPGLLFLALFVLSFVSVFLWLRAGRWCACFASLRNKILHKNMNY